MQRALIAGTAYFAALFALGFVLGAIRVTLVVPQLGMLGATAVEAPIMLAAGWWLCRRTVRHWRVPEALAPRATMALWFVLLLFVVAAMMGLALFWRSLADQGAQLATSAGALGLAAQLVTALFPLVVRAAPARD
ncbi:hypothetical protein IP88_00010 [alpha proteobacterium AAP81b]|nr:hypothetical protein IP88_00010 [alpha proteobacterium AAP81b]